MSLVLVSLSLLFQTLGMSSRGFYFSQKHKHFVQQNQISRRLQLIIQFLAMPDVSSLLVLSCDINTTQFLSGLFLALKKIEKSIRDDVLDRETCVVTGLIQRTRIFHGLSGRRFLKLRTHYLKYRCQKSNKLFCIVPCSPITFVINNL